MSTKPLFKKKPEIKALREVIDQLQLTSLTAELDKVGLSTIGFENVLKDRLFRFRVLQVDPNAPYESNEETDIRVSPFTTEGYNVQSFRLGGHEEENAVAAASNNEQVKVPVNSKMGVTTATITVTKTMNTGRGGGSQA